eukprot:TRINITY_DN7654_c0_g1_i1.p1 TRINITY_DN7654_c0_g1~~TRINITY_DN7654_c0_g1_i1.p1  ORF type:complete len:853 (-),score=195.17 TRINITY_DN7654_c0_g1_i1:190-2655(-)
MADPDAGGCNDWPTLRRQLRRAMGDAAKIMELVRAAEALAQSDPRLLCEVYEQGMKMIGPMPLQRAPREYAELAARRLQALCNHDADEARCFHRFLRDKNIAQTDHRTWLARAQMEERLGNVDKAAALLDDGLRANAPSEPLRSSLQKLLATSRRDAGNGGPGVGRTSWARRASGISSLSPIVESEGADADHGDRSLSPAPGERQRSSTGTAPEVAVAEPAASALPSSAPNLPAPAADPIPERPSESAYLPAPAKPEASGRSSEAPAAQQKPSAAAQPTPTAASASSSSSSTDASPTSSEGSGAPLAASVKPQKSFFVNGKPYVKLRELGHGGSCKVYEVRAPCGAIRALKRVTTDCMAKLEAFANEVTLLRQLEECSHVVTVFDAELNKEQGFLNIVMERGQVDLARFLQSEPDMTIGDIQVLWRQMLESVKQIHSKRIVHSDLKPSNFLLVDGRLKLIDFGIARQCAADTSNILVEEVMGTVSYMAPEKFTQGEVKLGRASDVWSLGIILYQVLYRHAPFSRFEIMDRVRAIPDPNVPVEYPPTHRLASHDEATKAQILDVLQKCLQRAPQERASIDELLQHEFLQDRVQVTRRTFDRAIEAIVAAFYQTTSSVLDAKGVENATSVQGPAETKAQGEGAEDADGESPQAPHHDAWQAIADDIWRRMLARGGDQACMPESQRVEVDPFCPAPGGTEPFRAWLLDQPKRRRVLHQPSNLAALASQASGDDGAPASEKQQTGASLEQEALAEGVAEGQATHAESPQSASVELPKKVAPASHENPARRKLREMRLYGADEQTEEMSQVTRWAFLPQVGRDGGA